MIFGFEPLLFAYICLAALFWTIRRLCNIHVALIALVVANILLLFLANVLLLFYVIAQCFLVYLLYIWIQWRKTDEPGIRPWFSFLGLFPLNFEDWISASLEVSEWSGQWGRINLDSVSCTIGASFLVIKSFIMLKEALRARKFDVLSFCAGLTFVPSFAAGPIHCQKAWQANVLADSVDRRTVLDIFLKIGWGGASLLILAPGLRAFAKLASSYPGGWACEMYIGLAALYFDFSGYSNIAIACAKMFGVSLPTNFNKPYLATSIQEFWRRWHMSLNLFIGTYLFKPLVRRFGRPQYAILVAFLFVGLWHRVTLEYLLWGIGHGLALGIAHKPPAAWRKWKAYFPHWIGIAVSWWLTMTLVASLSYFANSAWFQ